MASSAKFGSPLITTSSGGTYENKAVEKFYGPRKKTIFSKECRSINWEINSPSHSPSEILYMGTEKRSSSLISRRNKHGAF